MTYKQAYNKIIDAYFKDQIMPLDANFCFCGTLCNNTASWFLWPRKQHRDSHNYFGVDFVKMERALLDTMQSEMGAYISTDELHLYPSYEDALFSGMCAALEVLREIHKSRGENVDEEIPFVKRQLKTAV